jgi:hypothetical protein
MSVQSADLCLSKKPKDLELDARYKIEDLETRLNNSLRSGDFDRAAGLRDEIAAAKAKDRERKEAAEKQRQEAEQRKLNTAFKRMNGQAETRVEEIARETETECEAKLVALREMHQYERDALEEEIARLTKMAKLRFSPSLIAMKDSEARLIKASKFEEAKEVHRRVQIQEERETAKWSAELDATMQAKRDRVAHKQEGEMNFLLQQLANIRVKGKRARDATIQLMQQRKTNLEKDMAHAHRMEMILMPDPSGTVVSANPSHHDTASTYMGTLLLEKQTGSRFAIPSVCAIEEMEQSQGLRRSVKLG